MLASVTQPCGIHAFVLMTRTYMERQRATRTPETGDSLALGPSQTHVQLPLMMMVVPKMLPLELLAVMACWGPPTVTEFGPAASRE